VSDAAIATALCLLALACGALVACGGTTPPSAAHAPAPAGCGRFCQQAGPLQAGGDACEGIDCGRSDCPAYGCPPCPKPGSLASQRGCVELLADAARLVDGTVAIPARCRWSIRCAGALVLFRHPAQLTPEDRIGAADLVIPPRRGATIRVGLTRRGGRAVPPGGALRVAVVVVLKWAQGAPDTSQRLRIVR
jgi:hypothetical protein